MLHEHNVKNKMTRYKKNTAMDLAKNIRKYCLGTIKYANKSYCGSLLIKEILSFLQGFIKNKRMKE